MSLKGESSVEAAPAGEDEAAETFIQRLYGEWTAENQAAFERRLESDFAFAAAYRHVEESWRALDTHAETPELMTYRAEAIFEVRRANALRWVRPSGIFRRSSSNLTSRKWTGAAWKIAAAVSVLALLGTAWQLSPYGYKLGQYRTAIGEQRIIELDDHSRITIDAATRMQVRFSSDARLVELSEGQAQFSVAKDPSRPFKVIAGNRTIIALGTVFTVEYVDRKVHVAMMEGRVAVVPSQDSSSARASSSNASLKDSNAAVPFRAREDGRLRPRDDKSLRSNVQQEGELAIIELAAGEEMHVAHNGKAVVTSKADLEAATAWREGKVIFRTEPLSDAVNRMNRYSRLQLQIDDASLASKHISGVFEAGDTRGFVNALERYLPVIADYSDSDTVRLKAR